MDGDFESCLKAYRLSQESTNEGERAAARGAFERKCQSKGIDPKKVEGMYRVQELKKQARAKAPPQQPPAAKKAPPPRRNTNTNKRSNAKKPAGSSNRKKGAKKPGFFRRALDSAGKRVGVTGVQLGVAGAASVACAVTVAMAAKALGVAGDLVFPEAAGEDSGWDDATGTPR